ncbi:hypothetical protein Srufu_079270 (plasmid) [Streptomyces libani subsp. rufus]|nr:hypothetical protein Srufu_079270 [Streptomyces libani subsp. rufus]
MLTPVILALFLTAGLLVAWWWQRRQLAAERATRRLTEAAQARDVTALDQYVRQQLVQQQREAAVFEAAASVIDNALRGRGRGTAMHSARRAWMNLTEHRHYAYRGCAPDLDEPTRAQGDLNLGVDAWLPYTEDDGEQPSVRIAREKAAAAVCQACPVLAQCRAYGLAETPDGKLAEPEGVFGGCGPWSGTGI